MPKNGFRSITVSGTVYENFFKLWVKQKNKMNMQGVTSFSGFVTHELSIILKKQNEK